MAVNAPVAHSSGGFSETLEEHPTLVLGGGVVLVLLFGGMLLKKKTTASTSTSTTSDLSGLTKDANGNPIVYVPTSTNFTTINTDTGNTTNNTTNNQQKTTIANTTNNQKTTIANTTNNPVKVVPIPVPTPVQVKAPPVPAPVHYALYWDETYTFKQKETVGGLAYDVTKSIKHFGAPNSLVVTWQQIYNYNMKVLDTLAKTYKYKSTNIANMPMRGGEKVVIPEWRKG